MNISLKITIFVYKLIVKPLKTSTTMKKFIINVGYKKGYVRTYHVECEELVDAMIMARTMSQIEEASYASIMDIKTGKHTMYIDV